MLLSSTPINQFVYQIEFTSVHLTPAHTHIYQLPRPTSTPTSSSSHAVELEKRSKAATSLVFFQHFNREAEAGRAEAVGELSWG